MLDPELEARKKRRMDATYAKVRNHDVALYTSIVAIASLSRMEGLGEIGAARLEGRIMAMVADALGL